MSPPPPSAPGGPAIRLVRISGPPCPTIVPAPGATTVIGRDGTCDVQLRHRTVSNRHASLRSDGARGWILCDEHSSNGTYRNGRRIASGERTSLVEGTLVGIGPYVFRTSGTTNSGTRLDTVDDRATAASRIETLPPESFDPATRRRLDGLIEMAVDLQAADSGEAIHARVIRALELATGFDRHAIVRPDDDGQRVVMLAESIRPGVESPPFSRTLVAAARERGVVRLDDAPALGGVHSLAGHEVQRAVCIPIRVGQRIDSYLYLDASRSQSPRNDDEAFAVAIARFAGLALAEQERGRQARELDDARDVQRRLMPDERGTEGGLAWSVRQIPGRELAGDLFGVIPAEGRVVAYVGDVTGKGAAAALLMATVQAWLAARVERSDEPLDVLARGLDAHVRAVSPDGTFVTMMLAAVADGTDTIDLVDAGHGDGWLVGPDGTTLPLADDEGGLPIGLGTDAIAPRVVRHPFTPGHRVVIATDGVPEQADPSGRQLGRGRVVDILAASDGPDADVEGLVRAALDHAAGARLADDLTVASLTPSAR